MFDHSNLSNSFRVISPAAAAVETGFAKASLVSPCRAQVNYNIQVLSFR